MWLFPINNGSYKRLSIKLLILVCIFLFFDDISRFIDTHLVQDSWIYILSGISIGIIIFINLISIMCEIIDFSEK
jgi:hypothetical protein